MKKFILLTASVVIISVLASYMLSLRKTNLPATQSALGIDVTLKKMVRMPDGKIQASFLLKRQKDNASNVYFEAGDTLVIKPAESDCVSDGGYSFFPDGKEEAGTQALIEVPKGTKTITISQEVLLRRASKEAVFRFSDISAKDLPITRKFGDAEITLKKMLPNQVYAESTWIEHVYLRGGFTPEGMKFFGISYTGKFPGPYVGGPTMLIDENGKRFDLVGKYNKYEPKKSPTKLPPFSSLENLVYLVNREKAVKMKERRLWDEKQLQGYEENHVFGFVGIKSVPKKFTLEIKCTLPPDPKDKNTVIFKNVPLPK